MSDKEFKINFSGIEIMAKSINEPPILENGAALSFTFNFNIDLRVVAQQKIAIVKTDITITDIDRDLRQLAAFKMACIFQLPDFETIFTKQEENKYDMPVDLEIILKSASLSSVRGIIFYELRGTYMQGAILPLVDLATLIKSDREKIAKSQSAAS